MILRKDAINKVLIKYCKYLLFYFYLGFTGQGSDFNSACPKMAMKILRWRGSDYPVEGEEPYLFWGH
jgi:hypothetical protein